MRTNNDLCKTYVHERELKEQNTTVIMFINHKKGVSEELKVIKSMQDELSDEGFF